MFIQMGERKIKTVADIALSTHNPKTFKKYLHIKNSEKIQYIYKKSP